MTTAVYVEGAVTAEQIRVQLRALLSGVLDFADFWAWLRLLQHTISAPDPARTLLFRVIARLDEYDSSDMTDQQLAVLLLELA